MNTTTQTPPQKTEKYGWRRDRLDPRDIIFNAVNRVETNESALPSSYDLADQMPSIYDQGQLGSCTANSTGAIIHHREMVQGEATANDVPSRLFIYYEERRLGGYPLDQDTGAEVRDGLKVLATDGAPRETDWVYDISKFAQKPPDVAYTDAVKYKAVQYQRIIIPGPGYPVRTAIVNGHPVAFGFPVPALFEDPNWNPATQVLPLPTASTKFVGGHAVVIVGFDFTMRHFSVPVLKIRNSWRRDWGDAGHFYMDYRWFDPWRQLADDLWVVTKSS